MQIPESAKLLKDLGQVAGIGGICVGIFFLLLVSIVRQGSNKNLPLPGMYRYRLYRLIIIVSTVVALAGLASYKAGTHIEAQTKLTPTPTPTPPPLPSPTAHLSPAPKPRISPTPIAGPPNCIKMERGGCKSYRFEITLHGEKQAKEYYTVTGLKPGAKLRATYRATVLPAVPNPDPAGATVIVRVFGPGTSCGDYEPCESGHRWRTSEPWEDKQAMVEVSTNEASVVFSVELIVCSYVSNEYTPCKTIHGGTLTVDVL